MIIYKAKGVCTEPQSQYLDQDTGWALRMPEDIYLETFQQRKEKEYQSFNSDGVLFTR